MFLSARSYWHSLKHRIVTAFARLRRPALPAAWRQIVSQSKRRRGGRRSRRWIDGWWTRVHETRRQKSSRLRFEQLELRYVMDVSMSGGPTVALGDTYDVGFSDTSVDDTINGWTVAWGDGNQTTGLGADADSASYSSYSTPGTYTVTATADVTEDGTETTVSGSVVVTVTDPTGPSGVTISSDQSSYNEGDTV